jgi:5-methylcytosine-specific restriction protein A
MIRTPMKRSYRNTGPDRDTVTAVLARASWACECCDDGLHGQRGVDFHIHHRRPRQMGGTRWDGCNLPSNLLALCAFCHADVESRRAHAQDMGRLVPNVLNPADVAVLVAQHWVFLTDDATYSDKPPERAS